MTKIELSDREQEPLAESHFFVDDEEPIFTFSIWVPQQKEGEYPSCKYELRQGSDILSQGYVSGVDPMDSLVTCLAQAGTKVAGLNESRFDGKLRWEASPEEGLD